MCCGHVGAWEQGEHHKEALDLAKELTAGILVLLQHALLVSSAPEGRRG